MRKNWGRLSVRCGRNQAEAGVPWIETLMCLIISLVGAVPFHGEATMAQETNTIIEFDSAREEIRWRIVNDGVMGGLSQSRMVITENQTGVFEGTVSLENNGGFASVRTEPADLGLAGHEGLIVRVLGDGKRYQLRLRMDRRLDGIAYRKDFDTVADEWITVRAKFEDFVPTFRGRKVSEAPELDPARIRQIAFLISDYQEGQFRLEVDSIRAYR